MLKITSFVADAVGLTMVHGELLVHEVDYIGPDWGFEDGGQSNGIFFNLFGFLIVHAHQGACGS